MGSYTRTLKGSTKLDVYLQLRESLDDVSDTWAIRPTNKRDAYKAMIRDESKREWKLAVRYGK